MKDFPYKILLRKYKGKSGSGFLYISIIKVTVYEFIKEFGKEIRNKICQRNPKLIIAKFAKAFVKEILWKIFTGNPFTKFVKFYVAKWLVGWSGSKIRLATCLQNLPAARLLLRILIS